MVMSFRKPLVRDLLLAIVRSDTDAALPDRLRIFTDWELFLDLAQQLRLAPRVYLNLSRSGLLDYLPANYQQALKVTFEHNLGHSIACSSLLIRLVEILGREGVEVALLKGIAYMYDCYLDPGERVVGDIDLLIREQKISTATSILVAHGFNINPAWALNHPGHHHIAPIYDDSGLTFEIHHNLAPAAAPVAVSNQSLWKKMRQCEAVSGAYMLDPVDALIHSSIHLMVSSPIANQVYQLVDIHQLIQTHFRSEDSFSRLMERAREFSCVIFVTQALILTQRLLGTQLRLDLSHGSARKPFLLHMATATIAGPVAGIAPWRYELYRDLLDYRKQLFERPRDRRRLLFLLTRPLAIIKDMIGVFAPRRCLTKNRVWQAENLASICWRRDFPTQFPSNAHDSCDQLSVTLCGYAIGIVGDVLAP